MSRFVIEYVIEAEDLSEAASIAHENVYFADIDVEEVRVHVLRENAQDTSFRTFDMSGSSPVITDMGILP